MTTQATYRIDELDAYSQVVNSVGGLVEAERDAYLAILTRSVAHVDGRFTATWTRELTTAEVIAAAVADWRAGRGNRLTGRAQIAAALQALAADIAQGDEVIGEVHVEVSFSVHTTARDAATDSASAVALAQSMHLTLAEASGASPGVSFHTTPRELPVRVNAWGTAPASPKPVDLPAAVEPTASDPDVLALAHKAAADLGTTAPSIALNDRIKSLTGFGLPIKYRQQKVVVFSIQGGRNHVGWNSTAKAWEVIER